MAVYINSNEKLKFMIDGVAHYLQLYSDPPITNGLRLLMFEGWTLKDSHELFITVKESE